MLNIVYYYSSNPDLRTIRSVRLIKKDFKLQTSRRHIKAQIRNIPVYLIRLSENLDLINALGAHPFPKGTDTIYEYEIDLMKNKPQLSGMIDDTKCGVTLKALPEAEVWNHKYWHKVSNAKEYRILKERRQKDLGKYNFNKHVSVDDFVHNKDLESTLKIGKIISDLRAVGSNKLPMAWLFINDGLNYTSKVPVMLNTLSREEKTDLSDIFNYS